MQKSDVLFFIYDLTEVRVGLTRLYTSLNNKKYFV